MINRHRIVTLMFIYWVLIALPACRSPESYRLEADSVATEIIREKRLEAIGKTEPFDIERPSDTLRRKLLADQSLQYAGAESLGTDQLSRIDHRQESDKPAARCPAPSIVIISSGKPLSLSLHQALQIAARNSPAFQTKKEKIFLAALDLDLEREAFRNTFIVQVRSLFSTDAGGNETVTGIETGGEGEGSRKMAQGAEISAGLAIDLANLLTMGGASSLGLLADASISIPLLRGSGRHIVTEPLTQAERNVIYAIYDFERFKQSFAVTVAQSYLSVLQQMDDVRNAEENYRSLIASARRSRRLADAGRLTEIQVDQAVQNELKARDRWIASLAQSETRLDAFKNTIGLPPDAAIELDRTDLNRLQASSEKMIAGSKTDVHEIIPPADAPIELVVPSNEDAGALELDETKAIPLALENRLDLRAAIGAVYDAQRKVIVAEDALRAELTLLGSAAIGERRRMATATEDNARLQFDKGYYEALLTIDLPFERTAERNAYRKRFIDLENAVRDVQSLEDQIKLSIRSALRTLSSSRESLKIQSKSVAVAEKRVRSINLFLEAGRAEIRDLLEAQEALLSAQNKLTQAVIDYRIAELEIQRDMGLLEVSDQGLWQEYK